MVIQLALLLVAIAPLIQGYCFTRNGRVDETVSGRRIAVCEYNGLDLLHGSAFRTASCMDCRCTNGIIQCCGFGVQNETTYAPQQCTVISDGCEPLLVLRSNRTLDCYTGRPIKERPNINPIPNHVFPFGYPWMYPRQRQHDTSFGDLFLLGSLADTI